MPGKIACGTSFATASPYPCNVTYVVCGQWFVAAQQHNGITAAFLICIALDSAAAMQTQGAGWVMNQACLYYAIYEFVRLYVLPMADSFGNKVLIQHAFLLVLPATLRAMCQHTGT